MGVTVPLAYQKSMKFFDYQLTTTLNEGLLVDRGREHPMVMCCLNPHSFVTALEDEPFHKALQGCDMLLPDGIGVCMQLKKWRGKVVEKIAGNDFHDQVLAELDAMGGSIYYMGSSPQVLARIEQRLHAEHPRIRVRTYSPPYKPTLAAEDNAAILADINAFGPDALMVGMTAPKQEKWIAEHRHELQGVKVVGAIGGVFDFYAGTIKRAPQWAISLGIEWLWRFVREPRRMWQRNMVSAPRFLRYCKKHHEEM